LNAHFAKNNSSLKEKQRNIAVDIVSQSISLFYLGNNDLKNARTGKIFHVLFALLNFMLQPIALKLPNIALENAPLSLILRTPKKHNLQAQ